MRILHRVVRHRGLFGSIGLVVVVACAGIVQLLLMGGARSQQSSADESKIRSQIDAYLSIKDPNWPKGSYGLATMPASLMNQGLGHEKQVLRQVGTDSFAAKQMQGSTFSAIQKLRDADGEVTFAGEHQVVGFDYAGVGSAGEQLYQVRVWWGESRGQWDADTKQLVTVGKVDAVTLYQVTMVTVNGVWKIDKISTLELQTDADPAQYCPNSPHNPPGSF